MRSAKLLLLAGILRYAESHGSSYCHWNDYNDVYNQVLLMNKTFHDICDNFQTIVTSQNYTAAKCVNYAYHYCNSFDLNLIDTITVLPSEGGYCEFSDLYFEEDILNTYHSNLNVICSDIKCIMDNEYNNMSVVNEQLMNQTATMCPSAGLISTLSYFSVGVVLLLQSLNLIL